MTTNSFLNKIIPLVFLLLPITHLLGQEVYFSDLLDKVKCTVSCAEEYLISKNYPFKNTQKSKIKEGDVEVRVYGPPLGFDKNRNPIITNITLTSLNDTLYVITYLTISEATYDGCKYFMDTNGFTKTSERLKNGTKFITFISPKYPNIRVEESVEVLEVKEKKYKKFLFSIVRA